MPGELLVEDFGAMGDGVTDDMLAFQRAFNAAYNIGGAVVTCSRQMYQLGEYSPAALDNSILGFTASGIVSKSLFIPANTTLRSLTQAQLIFGGGTSAPFGYSTSTSLCSFPGNEESAKVIEVNFSKNQVRLERISNLTVGKLVNLARRGGHVSGVPSTPSQERSPSQFLTIRSIDGDVLSFEQNFFQRFDAAQSLNIYWPEKGEYPRNVSLSNLRMSPRSLSPGCGAYTLFSRTIGIWFDNISTDQGANIQFGTCQSVRIGRWNINRGTVLARPSADISSIESTSDFRIGHLTVNGEGCTDPLGGLFINDNSRLGYVAQADIEGMQNTGLALFYGTDLSIGSLNIRDCATTALARSSDNGALTVGFPALGSLSSQTQGFSDGYLIRNAGASKVHIRSLQILGPATVPVRSFDCDLRIDDANIEMAQSADSALGPFLIGQSGAKRADDSYFPEGGISLTTIGTVRVRSIGARIRQLVDDVPFVGSIFANPLSRLTAPASPEDMSLTISNAESVPLGAVYFNNAADPSSVSPIARMILSRYPNGVELSTPVGQELPVGTFIWSHDDDKLLRERFTCREFILDNNVQDRGAIFGKD